MYKFDSAGNVTILIKAAAPLDLLGVSYEEGDVVAFFDNAYFDLQFTNNNKVVTKGPVNLLHFNTMSINSITIHPKAVSHSTYNFIAAQKNEDASIKIPVKEEITTDSTGIAFFTRVPTNLKPVYIKDNTNKLNVTGYTIDYNTGQISGLQNSKKYLAFYYGTDISLIGYDLKEVRTPYFTIEIIGDNNTNGITRKMLLTIPKTSIDINTLLEFKQETLTSAELRFTVINGEASIVYY
jgi:hypothetical protein